MVKSVEDLQAQLLRLDRQFEQLEDGTTLVRLAPGQPPAALRLSGPLLVVQVEFGPAPKANDQQAPLYRQLLEYNASDLVHASYGIAEGSIILAAALELLSLDSNELEAVLSDFDLALSAHTPELRKLIPSH